MTEEQAQTIIEQLAEMNNRQMTTNSYLSEVVSALNELVSVLKMFHDLFVDWSSELLMYIADIPVPVRYMFNFIIVVSVISILMYLYKLFYKII